jgi:hypothetical protein
VREAGGDASSHTGEVLVSLAGSAKPSRFTTPSLFSTASEIARLRTIRALITGQLSSIWPQLSPASGRLPKRALYFRAQAARGCKQRLCVSCVVVSYHWTPFRQQHTQGLNWVLCARLLSDIILHPMPLRSGPTFWSSVVAIADNQIQQQLSRYETNFEPVRRYKFATASWSLGCKSTSFITL